MENDESYVIGLCDLVLESIGSRQHRFDFLRGDPSPKRKNGTKLPVDAYYETYNLVIEYHERQHSEAVDFFDNKMTCSGVSPGKQRRIYDQLRREVLPKNGVTLIEISFADFNHRRNRRIIRNENEDKEIIRKKLEKILKIKNL